ncbi:YceI family protein [Chloroflexi bacterium TSY]|nr:YceI family protein [Chloroflexi bacterium TSY]
MKQTLSKQYLFGGLSIVVALVLTACASSVSSIVEEPVALPAGEALAVAAVEPTESSAEEAVETGAKSSDDASASSNTATFIIVPDQSEARFYIDEELRGNSVTVVGVTSSLSGEILIDPANPANTQIGVITIDAASFVTDSNRRDTAIRRFVLRSGTYPTITFTPTTIEGFSDTIGVGDTFDIQVTGDLTIKAQTRSETFATTVTADSDAQVSGLASASIIYADYDILIPDVPFVANVGDELKLEFDFVAIK